MDYTIKSSELTVGVRTKGAVLTSIADKDGFEYLWQGDPKYWPNQAPNLFPICGSIRNDEAKLRNGKTTRMGRHGFIRPLEFSVEKIEEDSISLVLEETKETLSQYPFAFKLSIGYKVTGKTVTVSYQVKNKNEEDMPFILGGHPAFQWPLVKGESKEAYKIEFEQTENVSVPTPVSETGLIDVAHRTKVLNNEKVFSLKEDMFDIDATIFDELKSRKLKYYSEKSNKGVEITHSEFPYLIVWSSTNRGDFLAIEPWLGLSTCSDESDVFEEKRNMQIASANETKDYSYTIKVF